MRHVYFAVPAYLCLYLATLCFAQHQDEAMRRMHLRLAEPIAIAFDNSQLASIEEFFNNTTGQPLRFDWESLALLGVEKDTPILLTLPAAPAETAIKLTLYAAIAGVADDPPALDDFVFTFRMEGDKAVISVKKIDRPL